VTIFVSPIGQINIQWVQTNRLQEKQEKSGEIRINQEKSGKFGSDQIKSGKIRLN
jgi:hypothetical protein